MAPARGSQSPALSRYSKMRDFGLTPEPVPSKRPARRLASLSFVIQKHWASRLHYDFRLELDGVLLSWAVPKGPCYDPKEKRMAVHVEDHPVEYSTFEGTIPPKQYGAGKVIVRDRGTWEPVGDPHEAMKAGKLVFRLHGEKLAGLWELVRISKPEESQDQWMMFKKRDEWAQPLADYDVVLEELKRYDAAGAAYQRCIELDPKHADAHFNLVRLSEIRGDKQGLVLHLSAYRRLVG